MHVVLLGALSGQDEGLGEPPHRLPGVGQLAGDLHDHAVTQGGLGVHLGDLGVTVAEVQLLNLLVDLLLPDHDHRVGLPVRRIKTAVHKRGLVVVESIHDY